MKIKFSKSGIIINSKKFDPLNFNIQGYEVKSDIKYKKRDPFEMLQALASIKDDDETKTNKLKTLKSMAEK